MSRIIGRNSEMPEGASGGADYGTEGVAFWDHIHQFFGPWEDGLVSSGFTGYLRTCKAGTVVLMEFNIKPPNTGATILGTILPAYRPPVAVGFNCMYDVSSVTGEKIVAFLFLNTNGQIQILRNGSAVANADDFNCSGFFYDVS